MERDFVGRTVFLCTRAGTRAALRVRDRNPIYVASFLSASATARRLRSVEATYMISGQDGEAAEDLAAARFIDRLIADPQTDPAPFLREADASPAAAELREGVMRGYTGVHADDVALCLRVDVVDFACVAVLESDGLVVRRAD